LDGEELFTNGMPKTTLSSNDSKSLQIAIIARQNVGKSMLVNTRLEAQRALTGPTTPGLTQDAIAVKCAENGQGRGQQVDTGLTKCKDNAIEDLSVADALRAMKTAEVAVLLEVFDEKCKVYGVFGC
jgi:GTP-binding protein